MLLTYILLGIMLIVSSIGALIIGAYWLFQAFLELNKRRPYRKIVYIFICAMLGAILWSSAAFGLSIIFGDLTLRMISS